MCGMAEGVYGRRACMGGGLLGRRGACAWQER